MRFKATKGKSRIGMEVKDATYVEAAKWGKYRWWRYVLGLVAIFFVGLVVGGIATPRIAFLLGGQEALAAFSRLDYAAFG
ncbi:MAG TPA: CPBP family intramembrane glutamate endopeptidase, partial [Allocoleopsis sp.]